MLQQVCFGSGNCLQNTSNQHFFVYGGISAPLSTHIGGIVCQCFSQCLHNADIVHNQPIALALRHTVGPGNGLHQSMRFQGFVQIQAGQAFYIEARKPHSAHKHYPQRILRIFELFVQFPLFHFLAMGFNIQVPFLECLNFILFLTDNHCHFGFFHPGQFSVQFLGFLLCSMSGLFFQPGNFLCPVFLHQIVHPHTGYFVQADKHSLTAGPQIGIMLHKIPGNGLQPLLCCKKMYFLGKFPLQFFLLVRIQVSPFNGFQNPVGDFRVVQVGNFIAPVFIIQRHCCTIFHRPFEIIYRYVTAKGAFSNVVTGQQRSSGESDPGSRRQKSHHILSKNAVLTPVCLVGQNQNIMVRANWICVGYVEFLNQSKNKAGISLEFSHQVSAAGGNKLAGFSFAQQAAIFKGIADLSVQFFPVGKYYNRGRAGKLPPDLLGQEHHGIALAAALGMPKYPQLAVLQFPGFVGFYCLIYPQVLVIAGQDFHCPTTGVIE